MVIFDRVILSAANDRGFQPTQFQGTKGNNYILLTSLIP